MRKYGLRLSTEYTEYTECPKIPIHVYSVYSCGSNDSPVPTLCYYHSEVVLMRVLHFGSYWMGDNDIVALMA